MSIYPDLAFYGELPTGASEEETGGPQPVVELLEAERERDPEELDSEWSDFFVYEDITDEELWGPS